MRRLGHVRPDPINAVGVARLNAHGHAMTSTATADKVPTISGVRVAGSPTAGNLIPSHRPVPRLVLRAHSMICGGCPNDCSGITDLSGW